MSFYKRNLRDMLLSKAVLYGEFTLASGLTSTYLLDTMKVTMSSEGAYLTGLLMREQLYPFIDIVGGTGKHGAIPIIMSTLLVYHFNRNNLNSFFVRRQPKSTGTKIWLEGVIKEGANVALLEDVVTTGDSVLKAANKVKEEYPECRILKIVSLIDRLEGGRENIEREGYKYDCIFDLKELGLK